MKTDYNDRLAGRSKKTANKTPLIIAAAAVAGAIALGAWLYLKEDTKKPAPVVIKEAPAPTLAPQIEDALITEAPDIPEQAVPVEDSADSGETPAIELPDLADSDDFTRELLLPLSDSGELAQWLGTDSLLQKAVAVVDGLARGVLLKKVIPEPLPEGSFTVITEQDVIWLDEANYTRFDSYTDAITSIPPQSLANSFHTLRPLLERAYGELGGSAEAIDNRVIAAIDRMLATPDHNGPFALKRESVHYQFADPTLEALPGIQKQLLRIGPKNRTKLLNYLKELRVALLAQDSTTLD